MLLGSQRMRRSFPGREEAKVHLGSAYFQRHGGGAITVCPVHGRQLSVLAPGHDGVGGGSREMMLERRVGTRTVGLPREACILCTMGSQRFLGGSEEGGD